MLCEWKNSGFPIISTVWLKYSRETPCIVLYVLGDKMHNVTWVEIFGNPDNFHSFVEVLTWKACSNAGIIPLPDSGWLSSLLLFLCPTLVLLVLSEESWVFPCCLDSSQCCFFCLLGLGPPVLTAILLWILLNVLENNVHNVRWVENFGIPDNFHSLVVVLTCNFGEELFDESSLEDDFTNSLRLFFSPLHGFIFTSSSDVSSDEDSEEDLSLLVPFLVVKRIGR